VYVRDVILVEHPSRDSGLVGDDNQEISGAPKLSKGWRNVRQELDPVRIAVVWVVDD
jgi:hypothetical protein